MSLWMFSLFHLPFTMILSSLTWSTRHLITIFNFMMSAQPYLLISALCWDTLIYYYHPPPYIPTGTQTGRFKRYLKKKPHVSIVGFPKRWVLLTMCLGMNGTLGMIHPATQVRTQLRSTMQNVSSLTLMVDFTDSVTFGQYHCVRFKEFQTGASLKNKSSIISHPFPFTKILNRLYQDTFILIIQKRQIQRSFGKRRHYSSLTPSHF